MYSHLDDGNRKCKASQIQLPTQIQLAHMGNFICRHLMLIKRFLKCGPHVSCLQFRNDALSDMPSPLPKTIRIYKP